MAEPLDYFFQGANLGMRAGQARIQQEQFRTNLKERARQFDLSRADQNEQFRTNLSERVRQFDLNREIALDELELRQDKFSLEQEKFQLDQKAQKINIKQDRMLLKQAKRELEEDEEYADYVTEYNEQLMAADPLGGIPKIRADVPKRIKDDLLNGAIAWQTQQQSSVRSKLAAQRLLSREKQYNEDVAWAEENAPQLLRQSTDDPTRFDIDADALRQARISLVEQRKADEALDRQIKIRAASGKSTKPAETQSEWMRRTYKDFIFEDESSMSRKYDPAAHREAAAALFGGTGSRPTPTPAKRSMPPITEQEAEALQMQYGTTSPQKAQRIEDYQKSRMQP